MTRLFTFLLLCFLIFEEVHAQVPKIIIVEHFTNTLCGICAIRNPGFYSNLSGQSRMLHIAFHPSAPYSNCLLNKHNTTENDARTNYYGVYGSTPRLVIQGQVISAGANYAADALFDPYRNKASPASIEITESIMESDSIRVTAVIKTEAIHNLGNLKLLVALAEDTLAYNAPNGENRHYDVFRKAMTSITGTDITLPATVGDSVVFTATTAKHPDWKNGRIYPVAILQESPTKAVVQAARGEPAGGPEPVGIKEATDQMLNISPNPAKEYVHLQASGGFTDYIIYDLLGKEIQSGQLISTQVRQRIGLGELSPGLYFVRLSGVQGAVTARFVKRD